MQTTLSNIVVSSLLVYPQHNRLPESLHNKNENDIFDFLILDAIVIELMMSIGKNGFFPGEPLLVVEDKEHNGKFLVVEGIRRLTAVKLLDNPDIATVQKSKVKQIYDEAEYHPSSIPCLIFEDRNDILRYVGYRHITGIKSWRLLERGRHLFHLAEEMDEETFAKKCRELAKAIGSRKDYVERLLIAYQLYIKLEENKFYGIKDIDDTSFHLNYYVDSLRRSNIVDFLGIDLASNAPLQNLDIDKFKELSFWFFKRNDQGVTRAKGNSEDLGKLDAILNSESSLKAFREGMTLQEAFELTDELDNIFEREIRRSITSLENADRVIHKVSGFYSGLKDDLITIRKLTTKIKEFRESLDKDDDEF